MVVHQHHGGFHGKEAATSGWLVALAEVPCDPGTHARHAELLATLPLLGGEEQSRQALPHTKLSGGTEKMLWPFRDSGWAQVAVTKACSILPSSHGGSHFSWQSHKKLSLLIWLQGKEKGGLRNGTEKGESPRPA